MMERRFRRDISSLQGMFEFVSEFVSTHGLAASHSFDFELILEELFTNVLKYHAEGKVAVAVRLERRDQVITISLTEFDVEAFDITQAPAPDLSRPLSERRVGGLGIHFVKQFADSVRYDFKDGISTTTITKRVDL